MGLIHKDLLGRLYTQSVRSVKDRTFIYIYTHIYTYKDLKYIYIFPFIYLCSVPSHTGFEAVFQVLSSNWDYSRS